MMIQTLIIFILFCILKSLTILTFKMKQLMKINFLPSSKANSRNFSQSKITIKATPLTINGDWSKARGSFEMNELSWKTLRNISQPKILLTFSEHRLHLSLSLEHVYQDTCRGPGCGLARVLSTVLQLDVLNDQGAQVAATCVACQELHLARLSPVKLENLNRKWWWGVSICLNLTKSYSAPHTSPHAITRPFHLTLRQTRTRHSEHTSAWNFSI